MLVILINHSSSMLIQNNKNLNHTELIKRRMRLDSQVGGRFNRRCVYSKKIHALLPLFSWVL